MDSAGKLNRFFDRHFWWIVPLGLAGLLTYPIFKQQAFPSASLEIKRPRLEVQKEAIELASKMGFQKKNPIEATTFAYEDSEKTFLEYEYPLEIANQMMGQEIAVWYWNTRIVKEYDQEKFSAMISPRGELIAFDRDIPNDRPLKSITHEQAQTLAFDYLKSRLGDAVRDFKLVKDLTINQAKRKDHSFTWENDKKDYRGAHNRYYLYVSGDQISQYSRYLHVPEAWQRKFDTLRSYNELLGTCAWFFIYLLQTTAAIAFVWGVVTHNIRWRAPIAGGLILAVFSVLDYFNHMPALIASYSPETPYKDFLLQLCVNAFPRLIWSAISGGYLFGGGELFYRKLFPKAIALEKLLTVRGLTQPSVIRGVLVGYVLVGVHLGWIVLYYMGGKSFNFWCPLGVENYQVLSDLFPFISAISLGVSASFEEELACRVVGLGLGMRVFKNFWVANLFQAAVWGFAHSSYPQEPAFARGIELTVVGLLLGWVLRRFGLIACITEHFLLDSFFSVESLLSSNVPALKVSAAVALLPPLSLPLIALLLARIKKPSQDAPLTNDAIPFTRPEAAELEEFVSPAFEYKPLSGKTRAALTAVGAIGLIVVLMSSQMRSIKGVFADARLSIQRDQAIASAQRVMAKHGVKPDRWMHVASCFSDSAGEDAQYMFEKAGGAGANAGNTARKDGKVGPARPVDPGPNVSNLQKVKDIISRSRQGYYWYVRFFKPMQSEEYSVTLDGQGRELSFGISREEDDKGASLTQDEARARAEAYLRENHPELGDLVFKSVSTQKRKNRIDHTIEFQAPQFKVAEADCKIMVDLVGDQVGNYRQSWDVPDSWLFERRKETTRDQIFSVMRMIAGVAGLLAIIWWGFRLARTGAVRWRVPIFLAALSVVALLIDSADDWPLFFYSYDTTRPLNSFVIQRLVSIMTNALSYAALIFLLSAFSLGALKLLAPRASLQTVFLYAIGKRHNQPDDTDPDGLHLGSLAMWVDASLLAYGWVAFTECIAFIDRLLRFFFSPQLPVEQIDQIASLSNAGIPVIEIGTSLFKTIIFGLMGIVAAGLTAKYAPSWRRFAVLSVFIIMIAYSGDRYWQDFAISTLTYASIVWSGYFFVIRLARTNYISYVLVISLYFLIAYIEAIVGNSCFLFVPELLFAIILIISPLFAISGIWLRRKFS